MIETGFVMALLVIGFAVGVAMTGVVAFVAMGKLLSKDSFFLKYVRGDFS